MVKLGAMIFPVPWPHLGLRLRLRPRSPIRWGLLVGLGGIELPTVRGKIHHAIKNGKPNLFRLGHLYIPWRTVNVITRLGRVFHDFLWPSTNKNTWWPHLPGAISPCGTQVLRLPSTTWISCTGNWNGKICVTAKNGSFMKFQDMCHGKNGMFMGQSGSSWSVRINNLIDQPLPVGIDKPNWPRSTRIHQ